MGARNSAPPLRVAKCQFFYTEQNRQTKFYPNKNVWIATVLAQNWTKLTQRILWWTTVHLPSKLGLKFYISMLNKSSQERLDFVKFACYPKLLPQPSNIFTRIYPSYPWHFATLPPLVQSRLRKSCKSYLSDKYVHCAWTKHVICLQTRT